MVRVLSWLRDVILPEPPPPLIPPAPAARPPLGAQSDARVSGSDEEMEALQQGVYEESRKNKQAALSSLRIAHVAMSAEERSRSVLDELMRSMDRGQPQR